MRRRRKLKKVNFRELYFGEAAAETEFRKDRDKFFQTFYDFLDIKTKIKENRFFLIKGPKGSGKTAISYYTQIILKNIYGDESLVHRERSIDELMPNIASINSLDNDNTISTKLVGEGTPGYTISAWKLYMALQFVSMIYEDKSHPLNSEGKFVQFWKKLRELGLVETEKRTADFPTVLRKVRERSSGISAKFVGHRSGYMESEYIPISQLGESILSEILTSNYSNTHYLLSIDGLDQVITNNKSYWRSIAALLIASYKIYLKIIENEAPIHLIIMCRSDIFRNLELSEVDKIGDCSITLNWGNHRAKSNENHLWDYLAKKAGISANELLRLFPEKIPFDSKKFHASGAYGLSSSEYILTSTRGTPREMTKLMNAIQDETPDYQAITPERVRNAVDNFGMTFLIDMIKAEAVGILSEDERESLEDIISNIPHALKITKDDMIQLVRMVELPEQSARRIAEFLYLSGAIGNRRNLEGDDSYTQFNYRRDTNRFIWKGPWVLTRGLMYGFNVHP